MSEKKPKWSQILGNCDYCGKPLTFGTRIGVPYPDMGLRQFCSEKCRKNYEERKVKTSILYAERKFATLESIRAKAKKDLETLRKLKETKEGENKNE